MLTNLLTKMKGEEGQAKKLFGMALQQARVIKARDAVMEAKLALRRVERHERVRSASEIPGTSSP